MLYSSTIEIRATPERIWQILTDPAGWPTWEPNCTRIDGRIEVGQQLTVHTRLSDRAFPANVASMDPPRSMVWSWSMPLGMFSGVRTFTLTPKGDVTEVYCGEQFSGWMLWLFGRSVPDLTDAFRQFAEGLKKHAESAA